MEIASSFDSGLSIIAISENNINETVESKANRLAKACYCSACNMTVMFFSENSRQMDAQTMIKDIFKTGGEIIAKLIPINEFMSNDNIKVKRMAKTTIDIIVVEK